MPTSRPASSVGRRQHRYAYDRCPLSGRCHSGSFRGRCFRAGINHSRHLSDIKLPPNVRPFVRGDATLVTIVPPSGYAEEMKAAAEAAAVAAAAAATATAAAPEGGGAATPAARVLPRRVRGRGKKITGRGTRAASGRARQSGRALCREPPQYRIHDRRRHRPPPWHRAVAAPLPGSSRRGHGRGRTRAAAAARHLYERVRARGAEAARFYRIDVGDIVVFHDEIDLPPGKIRSRPAAALPGIMAALDIGPCRQ